MSLDALGLFNVKDRVALVTGGSSGIGLMISRVRTPIAKDPAAQFNTLRRYRAWYQTGQKYISSLSPATQ